MPQQAQSLNQYIGTDSLGVATTIVAPDMTTACKVYFEDGNEDPVTMQCTKQGIKCVLPEQFVTFTTVVTDPTGASTAACSATPKAYTLLAGSTQIFTATAGEGWDFVKWTIDGVDVEGDEGTKPVALLTIPASPSPVVFEAHFQATITP